MTLNCITTKPIEVTRMSKKENVNYFLHCPISQLSIENNLSNTIVQRRMNWSLSIIMISEVGDGCLGFKLTSIEMVIYDCIYCMNIKYN